MTWTPQTSTKIPMKPTSTTTLHVRLKAALQRLIDQHDMHKDQEGVWDSRVQSNVVRWIPIDRETLCLQLEGGNCNDFMGLMEVAGVILPGADLILVVNAYDPPWLYFKRGDQWEVREFERPSVAAG